MKIWKWTLNMTDTQMVEMPAGAKLLTVQLQWGMPQIWALCNEAAPKEQRQIAIYGTGDQMPDNPGEYIATFQMRGGAFVFHAFEISCAT